MIQVRFFHSISMRHHFKIGYCSINVLKLQPFFIILCALLAFKPHTTQAQPSSSGLSLNAAAASDWSRWDSNHDGIIDRREIVTALKKTDTKGIDASIGAMLYQSIFLKPGTPKSQKLYHSDYQRLIENPKFRLNVQKGQDRLAATATTLFTDTDPSINGFRQGRNEDCYLIANLALLSRFRPNNLRSMLSKSQDGSIRLRLMNGETAEVTQLTDAEILIGSNTGNGHGYWLQAFEKAFGEIRRRPNTELTKKNAPPESLSMFPDYTADGLSVPTMEALTGHKVIADAVVFRREPKERDQQYEEVHRLLVQLTRNRLLVLLHTRRNQDKGSNFIKPPGWPDAHTFALLGYDASRRIVHCFNPWGNNFHPNGPAGLNNGYDTVNGNFDMPLNEFMALFKSMSYETSEMLDNKHD